jgi:hypothetical protein
VQIAVHLSDDLDGVADGEVAVLWQVDLAVCQVTQIST